MSEEDFKLAIQNILMLQNNNDHCFVKLQEQIDELKQDYSRIVVEKKKGRQNSGSSDDKTTSPTTSKRAEKKLIRKQFIEDDVTEIKDNRREDFAKARKIKDKKRTEASRNSLGKRVK